MKCISALSIMAIFGLVACDNMTGPISSGDFDPLRPPGSNYRRDSSMTPTFSAGQFVHAAMDNTAFFKVRPKGDADPDKLLKRATSMKVISNSDSYVKVELDSGEVGFVPTVMLENPNAPTSSTLTGPGQYQVYPPLPDGGMTGVGEPLPAFDPKGLPPEGAIPTVIDPDAPNNTAPVPPVTPTTDKFPTPPPSPTPPPTPVEPKVESTPPPPVEEKKEADPGN
jgi:hypothetical protein